MKLVYFKKKLSTKTLNYIGVAYCLSCSNHFGDVNDLTVSFWQFIWHFFWDLQSGTIKLLPLHEIPSGTEIAMGAMFCLNCLKTYQTEKGQKEYSDKLERLSAKFWISMASFNLFNGHYPSVYLEKLILFFLLCTSDLLFCFVHEFLQLKSENKPERRTTLHRYWI